MSYFVAILIGGGISAAAYIILGNILNSDWYFYHFTDEGKSHWSEYEQKRADTRAFKAYIKDRGKMSSRYADLIKLLGYDFSILNDTGDYICLGYGGSNGKTPNLISLRQKSFKELAVMISLQVGKDFLNEDFTLYAEQDIKEEYPDSKLAEMIKNKIEDLNSQAE